MNTSGQLSEIKSERRVKAGDPTETKFIDYII